MNYKKLLKISTIIIASIATLSIIVVPTVLSFSGFFQSQNNHETLNPSPNPPTPDKPNPPSPEIPNPIVPILPSPDAGNNNGGEEIKTNENEAVVNEWYRKIASRSVSINFLNDLDIPFAVKSKGTAWIMDYELTKDGSYPLKWYYSTNAHVASNLVNPNDYSPYAFSDPGGKNTHQVYFDMIRYESRQSPPGNLINDPLPLLDVNNSVATLKFRETLNKVPKTIFVGLDYLNSHPSKWNPTWVEEEIADVAILEIEFNNETQARNVTWNYADLPDNQKNKFATSSLLTNYESNILSDEFYVAGFPDLSGRSNFVLNTFLQFFLPKKVDNKGAPLSKFAHNSTFLDKPGVLDNIIGLPRTSVPYHGIDYKLSGLSYCFRYSALQGGSSGSMALNKNNEILGNHFASWNNSDVGLTMSYLSEGSKSHLNPYYYSEPYNLIYGGYSNQKNSYKLSMEKIYGKQPNTYLLSKLIS